MNDLKLFYTKPSSVMNKHDTWQQETLPIGNGFIGATVWGETKKERISLNEETLWSGGKNHNDPNSTYNGGNPDKDMNAVYKKIAAQVRNGESFDKEELRGVYDGYSHGYQPLGDLYIDFNDIPKKTPKDYIRSLKLKNGIADVSFSVNNKKYSRSYFVSNPDNVLVCLIECENGMLDFTVSLKSPHPSNAASYISEKTAYAVYEGSLEDNGLCFSAVFAITAENEALISEKNGSVTVKNTKKVVIFLSAGTDYENKFYNDDKTISYYYRSGQTHKEVTKKVVKTVSDAVLLGYESVLERHIKDFSALYNRVGLDLGQSSSKPTDKLLRQYSKNRLSEEEKRYLEVLLFQYGRYLLISSSRENNKLPTNLQGIWNGFTKPAWGSDIHININEQMNYWLSSNANLNECALPLIRYVSSLKEAGYRTAKLIFNVKNGFTAHTQNTPYGFTATGWSIDSWGWCPAAVAWLMQNCYDYYEYSLDKKTLYDIIYPMMRDQVRMYEEILVENDGKKLMPIAQSPEIGSLTFSNTYEQSLIWQLYSDTVEAAEILKCDKEEAESWKLTMEKLSPIEIGESGQVKEWYNETTVNSVEDTRAHRHLSNLLGLFPGNLFDTDEKKSAAYVSLMNKKFGHTGAKIKPEGGWTYAQLICSWARLGNGENAYYCFSSMIKNRLYHNLFDYHRFGKYGAFQIDANFGCTAGVCEMLVQSNLGHIEILPALPKEWKDGSFMGITAEGGFEINAQWKNSKLISAEILSKKGQPVKLKADKHYTVLGKNSAPVEVSFDGKFIYFKTDENERYFITS